MTDFKLYFKMLSDWQVSTGSVHQGRLDSVVRRDQDGLPHIPFTTIRGIWRDSAERLALAMDNGIAGSWSKLIQSLFGSDPTKPGQSGQRGDSRLTCLDARLEQGIRNVLRHTSRAALRAGLTFVKPGVAIDHNTKLARDDHLRFDEVARRGLELECDASFNDTGIIDPITCTQFLKASFLMIQHIGGNRRRGAGHCETSFNGDVDLVATLKALKSASAPVVQGLAPDLSLTINVNNSTASSIGSFNCHKLFIEILSPMVIPKAVQGNVVESHDYIPGTYLLSAVADMIGTNRADTLGQIARGDIVVEAAYPAFGDKRGKPAPFIWQQEKDQTGGPNDKGDIVIETRFETQKATTISSLRKGMSERFFVTNEKAIAFPATKLEVQTRNTIDDKTQRPEGEGGVFTYECLSPGQTLIAHVWVRGEVKVERSNTVTRIGRAKNTGYGHAKLAWSEKPKEVVQQKLSPAGPHRICLTSPLLLPTDGAAELPKRIAFSLGLKTSTVDLKNSMIRFERIDGWSGAWSLPKPSLQALSAGSVITISLDNIDTEHLSSALQKGAGQRRGEGYGRFVLLAGDLITPPNIKWEEAPPPGGPVPTLKTTSKLATQIQDFAIKDLVRKAMTKLASDPEKRKDLLGWTSKTSSSQCGALRSVMGAFENGQREAAVKAFLKNSAASDRPARSWAGKASETFSSPEQWLAQTEMRALTETLKPVLLLEKEKAESILKDEKYRRYAQLAFVHAAMKEHLNANPGAADG